MRYVDRKFCSRDRQNRTRVCLPGAGIGDVADRVEACMVGEGTQPIVFLSAGGNDLGRVGSEELFRRFKETLGKVRDRGGIPVVCGVLPRRNVGDGWLSRAIAVNGRLAAHCESQGWLFVDNWDLFYGKDSLYARDGVHLSFEGVEVLSESLERALSHLQDFLG